MANQNQYESRTAIVYKKQDTELYEVTDLELDTIFSMGELKSLFLNCTIFFTSTGISFLISFLTTATYTIEYGKSLFVLGFIVSFILTIIFIIAFLLTKGLGKKTIASIKKNCKIDVNQTE